MKIAWCFTSCKVKYTTVIYPRGQGVDSFTVLAEHRQGLF